MKIFNKALIIFAVFSMTLCTEKVTADTPVVFMIGDSTMATRNIDNDNPERGWGQALSDYLRDDIRVENHAKCGASTLSFINEGLWDKVKGQLSEGDYLIIEFGHNDEKPDPQLHTEPGTTFDANLLKFITEAREKGAIPILLNSIVKRNYPPTLDTPHAYTYPEEGTILVNTHGKYIDVPREIASKEGVPFIDMESMSFGLVSGLGPEASKSLYMWIPAGENNHLPDGKIDNTHPTDKGAHAMALMFVSKAIEKVPGFK